ncbi:hypothetical protein DFH09DRAFT_1261132 [Mycena vulgaris]|nr:hypothetical protein DFH09DRAFT_1261132 [Mycena vulgaris]
MANPYPTPAEQWAQLEQEFDLPQLQQGYADSYQFNLDAFDVAQLTALPPSQSVSLQPSRSNSRSSYTRSPYHPSAPLDPSHAPLQPPNNFLSFAQNSAFLSADQHEYQDSVAACGFAVQTASAPALSAAVASLGVPFGPFPVQPYQSTSASQPQPKGKRLRAAPAKDTDDAMEDGGVPVKPPGACARCKSLKIKCEFADRSEACRRCFNGGYECVSHGRKKRRTPPKREELLVQIREQAVQIQKLMAQLEGPARPTSKPLHPHSHPSSASPLNAASTLHSPALSPASESSNGADTAAHQAVADWLAKARGSLAEFDGFIGLGGAGMPKSYLGRAAREDSSSSGSEDGDSDSAPEDDEIEIEVRDAQGAEVPQPQRGRLHHFGGGSSARSPKAQDSKLATLPSEASPFGLMADLSLKQRRVWNADGEGGIGVANANFFRLSPTPTPDPTTLAMESRGPQILTRGLITPQEAEKLFEIYFQTMDISVSALDPVLHTPQKTCFRSPFLFTVVCAIASKFYTARPELYPQAMHLAQQAAGAAVVGGHKSVDLVQGFLLMSAYPVPARRWEEERGWVYLGLAIRIATDLNLHLPTTAAPRNETHAREMLNRTRTWLHCFNLDRSVGSQYGKPPTISNYDYTAAHAGEWWRSSPYNIVHSDIHISAYNAVLKGMSAFMARIYSDPTHPTGLNKNIDFEALATEADENLQGLADQWRLVLDQTDMKNRQNRYRCGMVKLAFSYARLVALSFGFQHAFGKNNADENPFFMRCLTAASDVVTATVHDLGRPDHRIYLRHGPIGVSIFVTFAASMLVKLLQPKFAPYLTDLQRQEIRGLVKSVIDLLGSPEVSVDDKHGPSLYARFLKGLLAAPLAKSDSARPRRVRRPNSARQDSDSSHASPTTSESLSPAPTTAALSFDRFAPPPGGSIDPFIPLTDPSAPDFFMPAMPCDVDMQALWPDDVSWMNQLQDYMKLQEGMGMYVANS